MNYLERNVDDWRLVVKLFVTRALVRAGIDTQLYEWKNWIILTLLWQYPTWWKLCVIFYPMNALECKMHVYGSITLKNHLTNKIEFSDVYNIKMRICKMFSWHQKMQFVLCIDATQCTAQLQWGQRLIEVASITVMFHFLCTRLVKSKSNHKLKLTNIDKYKIATSKFLGDTNALQWHVDWMNHC